MVRKEKAWRAWSEEEFGAGEVEALAEEAKRGYDLSEAIRLPVARPTIKGAGSRPRISFTLSGELLDAVRERAIGGRMSIGEIAEEALERLIWEVESR